MTNHSPLAAITGLSLIFLALCCQIVPVSHPHDAMQTMAQPFAHTLLVLMDLPATSWLVAFFILSSLFVVEILTATHQSSRSIRWHIRQFSYLIFIPPLKLALADGILNPKLY